MVKTIGRLQGEEGGETGTKEALWQQPVWPLWTSEPSFQERHKEMKNNFVHILKVQR